MAILYDQLLEDIEDLLRTHDGVVHITCSLEQQEPYKLSEDGKTFCVNTQDLLKDVMQIRQNHDAKGIIGDDISCAIERGQLPRDKAFDANLFEFHDRCKKWEVMKILLQDLSESKGGNCPELAVIKKYTDEMEIVYKSLLERYSKLMHPIYTLEYLCGMLRKEGQQHTKILHELIQETFDSFYTLLDELSLEIVPF